MQNPVLHFFFLVFFHVGCSSSVPELKNSKKVDFSSNRKNLTAGESIFFYDKSTSSPSSLEWTFEGGTPETSTEKDPKVAYLEAGKFAVSLKVKYAEEQIEKTEKAFVTVEKRTEPPYNGTIFIENNIINETDASSYKSIKSLGGGTQNYV